MTEATALNTQADRLAEAKRKQTERENGIRANAIKQGRELERAELALDIHKLEAAHEAALNATKAAHLEELARHDQRWLREETKHGAARFWSGAFTGMFVAGAIVAIGLALYTQAIMVPTFDAARESRVQDDVLRTLQERPPTTNQPRSESAP